MSITLLKILYSLQILEVGVLCPDGRIMIPGSYILLILCKNFLLLIVNYIYFAIIRMFKKYCTI